MNRNEIVKLILNTMPKDITLDVVFDGMLIYLSCQAAYHNIDKQKFLSDVAEACNAYYDHGKEIKKTALRIDV